MNQGESRGPLFRTLGTGVIAVGLGLAAWAWLRVPVDSFSAQTGPGSLFLDEGFAVRIWVPAPTERLKELLEGQASHTGVDDSIAPLEGILGGLKFGPFAVPPAREMTLAFGPETAVAAFRVSWLTSRAARLAGALAGNDVLRGGEFEIDSRRVTTRWSKTTWIVQSGEAPAAVETGDGERMDPSDRQIDLGLVALSAETRELVARRLREAGSEDPAIAPLWRIARGEQSVSLTPLDGQSRVAVGSTRDSITKPPADSVFAAVHRTEVAGTALVLLRPQGEIRADEIRIPSSGARAGGQARLPNLPAASWLADLGVHAIERPCGADRCLGLDERGLESVMSWDPFARTGAETGESGPDSMIWLDPAGVADFTEHLAEGLRGLMLVPEEDVVQARNLARQVAMLSVFTEIEFRGRGSEAEVRLWLP